MSINSVWFDQESIPPPVTGYTGLLSPQEAAQHHLLIEKRRAQPAGANYQRNLESLLALRTAELKAAATRTQLILDCCAAPLAGVDSSGRFTFVNAAACRVLNYPEERLIGRNARDILHCAHPDGTPYAALECPITTTLRHNQRHQLDHVTFRRADGHALPVSCVIQPLLEGNKTLGAVISFRDLTDQLAAQAELERALAKVQRLAAMRSESLAHLSHEIRTPLHTILGLAQLGTNAGEENLARETFAHIAEAGQALLDIVNGILDLAKIESGKLRLEKNSFDLNEMINRAVNLIAPQAAAKGLVLCVEKDLNLPEIGVGDPLRLAQILVNLLGNAVKFTSYGTVTLGAGWEENTLILRVSDTGIGMTEEQIARLFIPFEQSDDSIARRFGGTGLGLVITKNLIDLMEGKILVRSSPGQGSTFEVKIPVIFPALKGAAWESNPP